MSAADRVLDGSAIGLSGLCVAHCLALPVAAALLPVLGAWAEAEWVHVLFVLIVAPLSGLALLRPSPHARRSIRVLALAAIGITLLAAGAFVAGSKAVETAVTVVGSLCLASAHMWNWYRRASISGGPRVPTDGNNSHPY
ncbi:MerC domain-containing protein [Phenylobacterium sp.]|jgi:hypothetical protein|uniref:MerC domain-containing protein n=1 Tax=Phenylobacterium sp. TaxID=1871053 RepID=UPI0037CB713A